MNLFQPLLLQPTRLTLTIMVIASSLASFASQLSTSVALIASSIQPNGGIKILAQVTSCSLHDCLMRLWIDVYELKIYCFTVWQVHASDTVCTGTYDVPTIQVLNLNLKSIWLCTLCQGMRLMRLYMHYCIEKVSTSSFSNPDFANRVFHKQINSHLKLCQATC